MHTRAPCTDAHELLATTARVANSSNMGLRAMPSAVPLRTCGLDSKEAMSTRVTIVGDDWQQVNEVNVLSHRVWADCCYERVMST
jgi:hypothetical protein